MSIVDTSRVLNPDTASHDRRLARRSRVERLVLLAQHLPEPDRLLVEQVFAHDLRVEQVARLQRTRPNYVRGRLAKLCRRLNHPLFAFVAEGHALVPRHALITARLAILRGVPLREIARRRGLTVHQVRAQLGTVRAALRDCRHRASLPRVTFLKR
jgi:DNA-directed RNA polymerase specialized sigma24 family protein